MLKIFAMEVCQPKLHLINQQEQPGEQLEQLQKQQEQPQEQLQKQQEQPQEQLQKQQEQPQEQLQNLQEKPQEQLEEIEEQQTEIFQGRLGQCQRCNEQPAKYTCPGCGEHTCSLVCSTAHKIATGCRGRRDPTVFVPLSSFTESNLLSDYRFLESVDHSLDRVTRLRQTISAFGNSTGGVPNRQQRDLQAFCRSSRGIELAFMPAGMARRRANRSYLRLGPGGRKGARKTGNNDISSSPTVHWTVEIRFPTGKKFTAASETSRLSEIIQRWRHMWPPSSRDKPQCCLCRLDQGDRLCPVDGDRSLADLLRGTVVVEFPVFVVQEAS